MQGQILDFSIQNNRGVITTDDGVRHAFVGSEWKEQNMPTKGMRVDFDVNIDGHAIEIYKALPAKSANAITQKMKAMAPVRQQQNTDDELGSFFDIFVNTIKHHYVDFAGRASKREFWSFQLVNIGVSFILIIALAIFAGIFGMRESAAVGLINGVSSIYSLATFLPLTAVGVRRLHDTGKSGWWYLLALIPLIGWIWLIVLWCQPSDDENQWG